MQKITPFLWFDGKAREAIRFYTSVFKNSKAFKASDAGDTIMHGSFELEGQEFIAFDGGPMFNFSPAISLFVACETQEEIDYYWESLSEGGEQQQCGWLKDKFGISWQIVPPVLGKMLSSKDPEKSQRVIQAMLKMKKLDISVLEAAFNNQ